MNSFTLIDIVTDINSTASLILQNSKQLINRVTLDSRQADSGSVFVAIPGFKSDGHDYIQNAFSNGCRNFVVSDITKWDERLGDEITLVTTDNSRLMFARLCCELYRYPFNDLRMIGITGTKGKTSVTSMIYTILQEQFKSSMFSTVENSIIGNIEKSTRTTMEADALQSRLAKTVVQNGTHAVVEVSSHAVTLHRVTGINWDIGVFTNFSQDHLDLYGTMENYFDAKLDFFRALNHSTKKNKFAVINIDDPRGKDVVEILDKSVTVYTVSSDAQSGSDCLIQDVKTTGQGISVDLVLNNKNVTCRLPVLGTFNGINAALALSVTSKMGIALEHCITALEKFSGVKGRFDLICTTPFTVIIDYAHTPDSLTAILQDARTMTKRRLLCLFGCTGERDREKRPIMGEIAAEMADYSVITNDDTYDEDPDSIAHQVETGFIKSGKIDKIDYRILLDRATAVSNILSSASKGDVVVIAGKGHETVQYLASGAVPYSDHETVKAALEELGVDAG